MTLRELLGEGPAVEIGGLAYDNREVRPGTLFFCVPGFTRDGHDFAPDAVERGAAARFHGDPTARLPVVGITGTNGKTTTAFLVRSLLEVSGRQTGLLGTVTSFVGGEERPTVRTTP